jgi:hypothetical protein
VLHLESGVHLHEVELIGNGIKNEFNGAGVHIANGLGSFDCGLTDLLSDFLADLRGSLLYHLLVTSLH